MEGGNASMASFQDANVKSTMSRPNGDMISTASIGDAKMPTDRQYMIKIDNNDGTPPFPLSITLPHNLGPTDSVESNKIVSMQPITSQSNQTLPMTNPIPTPTLQSQINKIQNQLIGVQQNSIAPTNMSSTISTMTAASTTAISTTTLTTSSAQKTTKKKQTNKRNNKKMMETINVPSQIGNIQVRCHCRKQNKQKTNSFSFSMIQYSNANLLV